MIATRKDWKQRKAMREAPVPRGRIPNSLSSGERMERKLLTQRGRKLYRLRGQTVEPVFGQTKQTQGAERFMVRGEQRPKANGICIAACTISKSCTGRWFARELRRIPDNGHRFVLQNGLRCSIEDSFTLTSDIFACKSLILKDHGSKWGTTSEFPMSDRKKKERRLNDLGATRVL